jgi:hypothetical protein
VVDLGERDDERKINRRSREPRKKGANKESRPNVGVSHSDLEWSRPVAKSCSSTQKEEQSISRSQHTRKKASLEERQCRQTSRLSHYIGQLVGLFLMYTSLAQTCFVPALQKEI